MRPGVQPPLAGSTAAGSGRQPAPWPGSHQPVLRRYFGGLVDLYHLDHFMGKFGNKLGDLLFCSGIQVRVRGQRPPLRLPESARHAA
jgi:hypothetical protein